MSDSFKNLSELLLRLDQRYAAKGTVPSGTSSGGASPVTPHSLTDNFLHSATGLTVGYTLRATGAAAYGWAQLQHSDLGGVSADQHHTHMTIDANADTLLSLTDQAIGLDTQVANRVFAGPATGADAVPTFRALAAADIAHNLLSAVHSDTLTGTVVDGDVLIGNVTPKWSRLAISVPAAGVRNVLGVDNGETRPSWKTALDATAPETLTVSAVATAGTSLVFSHRDHIHPITSSANPGAAASILASDSNGALQLVNLTLTGNLSTSRAASSLIPVTTDTYDLGSSTLLWRKGYLSEMDALLFAENTITLLGGWFYISKDAGTLGADVASGATTIDFGKAMTPGHFVVMRNAAPAVEYVEVGSLVSGTTYNVTRNLDGTGANDWPQGTPFCVLGALGDGRIELNAYDTPRISLISQGATYNAQTELVRIGDLNGGWGYGAETFGVALGVYAASNTSLTVDATNGIRIFNNTTQVAQWDASGNITVGEVAASKSNVLITAGKVQIRNNTTDVIVFDTTESRIDNLLKMSGASAAIAIGATPPTSASAGTGIWLDRTGMYGLAANVVQAKFDAATGAITVGAGNVVLDASGITLTGSDGGTYLTWKTSGNDAGGIAGWREATSAGIYVWGGRPATGYKSQAYLVSQSSRAVANDNAYLRLYGTLDDTQAGASLEFEAPLSTTVFKVDQSAVYAYGGLNVGAATGAAAGQIKTSDDIIIADGKNLEWSDVNLYRSAANILKTDDAFVAVGNISSDGIIYGKLRVTNIQTTGAFPSGTNGDLFIWGESSNETLYYYHNGWRRAFIQGG